MTEGIQIAPYSSHLPLLVGAVAATIGDVIELGAGLYSTPVLQALCSGPFTKMITIETDREWLSKFNFAGNNKSILLDSWGDLQRHGELLKCSVAFIDVAPASARGDLIHLMRKYAEVIVVHDVEQEQRHNYPGVEEALQTFKYRVEDRRRGPWTAAVSDRLDINFLKEAIT